MPLAVAVIGFGVDPHGGQRAGFSATTRINRGEFGIDRWTGGGAVVSNKVPIDLEIETVLQKRMDPDRPPATNLKPDTVRGPRRSDQVQDRPNRPQSRELAGYARDRSRLTHRRFGDRLRDHSDRSGLRTDPSD